VFFGLGAEPDGEALTQEAIVRAWVGDDAAPGGEYEAMMLGEDGIESLTFEAAIPIESIKIKDDGQGDAGVALDLLVQFNERHAENLRKETAERGFAGTAKSDEGDAETAGGKIGVGKFFEKKLVSIAQLAGSKFFEECGGLIESRRGGLAIGGKIFHGNFESASDGVKTADGDIAEAEFNFGEVTSGERTGASELAKGHSAACAGRTNFIAELLKIRIHGTGFCSRARRRFASAKR